MLLKIGMSLGVFDIGMLTMVVIFLRSNNFPSFNTMQPNMTLENTKNIHFSQLKLISNSQHLLKHNRNFARCVFKSLKMLNSSKNSFMNTPRYSFKAMLIVYWQVGGVFFSLKGMTNHIKVPHLMMKVVLYQSFDVVMI